MDYNRIMGFFTKLFKSGTLNVKESNGPFLQIMLGEKHIADLYHDKSQYCLIYKETFLETNLPAFNIEDIAKSPYKPEIDKCYRSGELWHVFASRIQSLDRKDVALELKKFGLNKNSDPLLILGKLGAVSIANSWHLKIVS